MIRVGVIGATGFMGAELVRLFASHPSANLTFLGGGESAGRDLSDLRSAFRGIELPTIAAPDPVAIAEKCDAVFLALPHGASAGLAAELLDQGICVIDLGSDFRIRDRALAESMYDREPPRQPLLDAAFYSLPELTGPPGPDVRLIASPGCFATSLCLVLAPLAQMNLISEPPTVFGITGSSGSGIAPSPGVHHSLRMTNFVSYKALTHQHRGEVTQLLSKFGYDGPIRFVPHSAPLARGIHLTLVLPTTDAAKVATAYEGSYADCPMIMTGEGPTPLGSVVGTNRASIGWQTAEGDTVVTVAIDNLLKGGSGQAIQSFNLRFGLPETAGLPMVATWP